MQQNNKAKPEFKETLVGCVKITEYFAQTPPHTVIYSDLTKKVKTFMTGAPLERYRGIITSQTQNDISILFRLVEFLGTIGYSGDYDESELSEYQSVLGSVGNMLTESLESIDFAFDRHEHFPAQQSETLAPGKDDFSWSAVAKHISALVSNPNISAELHNALADYINELQNDFPEDWKNAEVIEELLKKKAAGGEK